LTDREGALLEVLRDRASTADLDVGAIKRRLAPLLKARDGFARLRNAALHEPPRVRAMLGALAEDSGVPTKHLTGLKRTLSPYSTYDFGRLKALRSADEWQAE